jgi:hypothetical protein
LTAGFFFLPSMSGCSSCNAILGSTGIPINGNSCQCQLGFIWSPSRLSCICDANQNFTMVNGICTYCWNLFQGTGFVTA